MPNVAQIDVQISKLQQQKDLILTQINGIESKLVNLRKQKLNTKDPNQAANIEKQIQSLNMQKVNLSGVGVQTEDALPGINTTSAGNISSVNGSGNMPTRFGVEKRNLVDSIKEDRENRNKISKFVSKF